MERAITNAWWDHNHSSIVSADAARTKRELQLLAPIPRLGVLERFFVIEPRQCFLDRLDADKCLIDIEPVDRQQVLVYFMRQDVQKEVRLEEAPGGVS